MCRRISKYLEFLGQTADLNVNLKEHHVADWADLHHLTDVQVKGNSSTSLKENITFDLANGGSPERDWEQSTST